MNKESSPLAGKIVTIRKEATHPQFEDFGGSEFVVEDYWDRLTGRSWMFSDGNPAAMMYGIRSAFNDLPTDNNVLYGKVGSFGHLVHVSEIIE